MKILARLLRHLLVWWLPALVMVLLCLIGLTAWVVGSSSGSALLLRAVASQLDGRVAGVQGSLWRGLQVAELEVSPPGAQVSLRSLNLAVDWRRLGDGVLRVQDLSVDALSVALPAPDPEAQAAADAPVSVPSLPVTIAIDRLAVGEFSLTQAGEPLPVGLRDLLATVAVGETAQLRIASLKVLHPMADVGLQGEVALAELAAPWPARVTLLAGIHSADPESPLCLKALQPGQAARPADKAKAAQAKDAKSPDTTTPAVPGCTVLLDAQAQGSLEGLDVSLKGEGAGVALRADASLAPQAAFPLRTADVDLRLADGSALAARLDWERQEAGPDTPLRDRIKGTASATSLDLGAFLAGLIPPALLTATLDFDVSLQDQSVPTDARLDLKVAEGSRWNRQALSGNLNARLGAQPGEPGQPIDVLALRVPELKTDLRLGPNRVRTDGSWGEPGSALTLDITAPQLAAFWPDLPGGATLQGKVGGTPGAHQLDLRAAYKPARVRAGRLGEAPANLDIVAAGGWGPGGQNAFQPGLAGWRGQVSSLRAEHAGFSLRLRQALAVAFLPAAQAPQWQWQAGAGALEIGLPGAASPVVLRHEGSRGGGARWQSAGAIENAVLTARLVRNLQDALGQVRKDEDAPRGGVKVNDPGAANRRLELEASWNLQFANALSGTARIAHTGGDMMLPGTPPVPAGLRELSVSLRATPTTGRASRLDAVLRVLTEKRGTIEGEGSAVLTVGADGALGLDRRQPLRGKLDAQVDDLSWVSLFTGDALDIGGSVRASLQGQGTLDGDWQARGTINGEKLRVVRIDDGVRLLDGTLAARLENERLIIDSLRFPASLRVIPTEWRTREWITENPDARNGELRASGEWNLLQSAGKVRVSLYRYPVIQRVDRHAMMTGDIDIVAALPKVSITGKLTADAGWASVEMLTSVPTVDDDVIVVREGQDVAASSALDMNMVVDVDLGPRFYLTGMGLDSGLVGALQVRMAAGRLSGEGAFRTRGGRFEIYGQRLHLRRGTITFQGVLENPLLDIEALRLGEQVEAGVRVAGTARRPRIDLVSYPDVGETEKLSWLILGRGPDQSGNDAALLLSVGAALLAGEGEPFYKKFGLDDVGIKSGAIGSSGSLLPDTTVAGRVTRSSGQELENQFLVASKNFSDGITVSIEQAMAGADTVARASYRLSRRLSVDLKGGAVNGLELVYRTFFQD